MKYLKQDDNRYRVRFMRATEELMDSMTVKQFISYLEENAELESDDEHEYIGGKVVNCKAYDLKEAGSNLHKEFLVTEDGRLFYWLSLNQRIELVDREEVLEMSKKYEVYLQAGTVKQYLTEFATEKDARSFCEEHDWHWIDGNEFDWDLDYKEVA